MEGRYQVINRADASVSSPPVLAKYYQTSNAATAAAAHVNDAPTARMCPRAGHQRYWNKRLRQPMPRVCQSLSCPVCVQVIANRYGAAIAYARPQQFLLLTTLGDGWSVIQRNMNRLWEYLRDNDFPIQAAWHAEANPRATGTHVHAWSHSAHIDRKTLQGHAVRSGMGSHVSVRPVRLPQGDPPRLVYGMKAVFSSCDDTGALSSEARDFLALNGGRLVHSTQGFFRDIDGQRLGIRDAAIRAHQPASGQA